MRVSGLVIDFVGSLLPVMAPVLGAPRSVRPDPGRLTGTATDDGEWVGEVVDALRAAATLRTGLRRLHVVPTRAVSALTVIHGEPLPAALLREAVVPGV